jgi:NADH-quinone oxidoreductase subunit G/NADP-reducing hydrogenase subunit HndD
MSDVSSTVNLTINDLPVRVPAGTTLLEAAQTLGIRIPILCYDKQLTVSGACRICVVEVANPRGSTRLEPACSFPAQEGMSVRTNTRELRDARRTIIELILANHPRACQTCIRNERCNLQALCREYSIEKIRYEGERRHHDIDTSSVAITRHPDFCILCGKCVKVCREVQGVYALDFVKRGFSTTVSPPFDRDLADTVCVLCGQCLLKCPVAAIRDKSYIKTIADALEDPQKIVTVQIAPSVRATVGELFGLPPGVSLTLKLPTALRRLGFRYVFDTDFGADMAVMEEGNELVGRLQNGGPFPLITSCSPGWVKFMEHFFPDFIPYTSSVKSPQQIVGVLTKTFFAERNGIDRKKLFNVSIMPCSAKKYEIQRPELRLDDGTPEVDAVLTTREFGDLLRMHDMDLPSMPESAFDPILGDATGAGLIFGTTGGMMEASLRTVAALMDPNTEPPMEYSVLRGTAGIKRGSVLIGDREIKLCAVSGLANARRILESIRAKHEEVHFLEVMACPGGCIGGGGQPLPTDEETRRRRIEAMYAEDRGMPIRQAHKSPAVQTIYNEFLGKPCSEKAHHLLHTKYAPRLPRGF